MAISTQEKLSTLDKISSAAGSIWAVVETIFNLPSIIAHQINQFLAQLLPWNPSINPTIATILALTIAVMWYPRWKYVTRAFGKIPVAGIFLAVYLHYALFKACQGVTSAGWFSAIILLALTAAFNYWPQFSKFLAWLGLGFGAGKRLAGKIGRGAKGAATMTKRLARNPADKAFVEALDRKLDSLVALYDSQGLDTETKLERLQSFVDKMKPEATPNRVLLITARLEAVKGRFALVHVPTTPTAEVAIRSLKSFSIQS